MSCILNIETATNGVCSVALSRDGEVLFNREDTSGSSHAGRLGGFVQQALKEAAERGCALQAVAVSCGPGSYTGLRIGVSMAKGLCFGRDLPLIALSTLKVLATPVLLYHELPEEALLCPMIDARRMEVYAGVYDRALRTVREVNADVVTETTYREWLDKGPVYFFGNGAEKCMPVVAHANAQMVPNILPLAKMMVPLAEKAFNEGEFVDVAYFEPFYLKEFVATIPKNKL